MAMYRALLGPDFDQLTQPLQDFHERNFCAQGSLTVTHNSNSIAKIVIWLTRLPKEGSNLRTTVEVLAMNDREAWFRRIGKSKLMSKQSIRNGQLVERFGPMTIRFLTVVKDGGLIYQSDQTRLFGLPVPKFARLSITASTMPSRVGWVVLVQVHFGKFGTICQYEGEMQLV